MEVQALSDTVTVSKDEMWEILRQLESVREHARLFSSKVRKLIGDPRNNKPRP
jgi:hypothetical protein